MCRCLLARLWQPWLDQLTQSTELRRYQISKVNFAKWGIRLAEMRAENWPKAREGAPVPEETWYRATSVNAPPSIVFRWICQLRAAPYSYDWIDNFGRQSPRQLIDGLERLRIGLKVMTIFRIHDFSTDQYLTIVLWPPRNILCSALRITYLCLPLGEKRTRLLDRLSEASFSIPYSIASSARRSSDDAEATLDTEMSFGAPFRGSLMDFRPINLNL